VSMVAMMMMVYGVSMVVERKGQGQSHSVSKVIGPKYIETNKLV
jgi:hypothetical protein